ncbi:MAG: hydrogen peroxide-inducible genes activator [Hyphomicrobiaceae bacterium]
MHNITIKQLRYFHALAREQHFGRAAESCSVTQPALSMQIQELEGSLGMDLVERTRSGVKLTAKGEKIAERAQRILNDVKDLVDFAKQSAGVLSGTLRMGLIPSVAPYVLPPLLPLLKKKYADLELHIRETLTETLLHELVEGKLDVLLLALPVKHADIETLELFEDRFVLAVPETLNMSGRVKATPELVKQERLLLLEEGHCLRDQALDYCSLKHVDTINTFGASSMSTIVEMVAAGLGITLLPELCITMEERGRDIKLMRFVDPEPSRTIGLVWRQSSPRAEDYRALGKLVLAAGQDTIKRGVSRIGKVS